MNIAYPHTIVFEDQWLERQAHEVRGHVEDVAPQSAESRNEIDKPGTTCKAMKQNLLEAVEAPGVCGPWNKRDKDL